MAKYVVGGHFLHARLGEVAVRVLSTATHISARWKSPGLLSVTVPPRLSQEYFIQALADMEARLLLKRPRRLFYTPGWYYHTPEMDFTVVKGMKPARFEGAVDRVKRLTTLFMPADADSEGMPEFNEWVNKILVRYSKTYAGKYLLPMARELAVKLNVSPKSVNISHGQKVLGRCNSRGEILLSRNLVFYPEDLREMVIAHEYAHLTYLNHSPKFYELLDTYLEGRHRRLKSALKAHKLPFV